MEILHLMVPIAIILVVIAIVIFFWAVRSGQFDDLERQGYNILLDDDQPKRKKSTRQQSQTDADKNDEKHDSDKDSQ
ncbi:cbb3-type cytochrome oxidase assembly protein CcoS [Aliidiomarina haloalkalitolerans]|uniref:Cbb3-type cytochrome oxidase assembly protein CcoS n=1 Tax=Aliidiomarina haloalkalitolerans TaxID=859059 RepID=A0A432VYC2_9GAMM|nr:cbb3-type cytochrome oxidase assembly protein CcoS [Aliidiomarina haloalkalitolerans]RUO21674.1 cbb3-type cytochrome oxidase assembly protein CcoS [Aliidiomarina haloalkalitolerans]